MDLQVLVNLSADTCLGNGMSGSEEGALLIIPADLNLIYFWELNTD